MAFIQDVKESLNIFKVNKQKYQLKITLLKKTRKTKTQLWEKSKIVNNPNEEEKEIISEMILKLVNNYDQSAFQLRQKGAKSMLRK